MIDAAMTTPPTFTVIVAHSFQRCFRDQFQLEFYARKLAKNGVKLVSITQDSSKEAEQGGDNADCVPHSAHLRKVRTLVGHQWTLLPSP